jgi:hypothetical protein
MYIKGGFLLSHFSFFNCFDSKFNHSVFSSQEVEVNVTWILPTKCIFKIFIIFFWCSIFCSWQTKFEICFCSFWNANRQLLFHCVSPFSNVAKLKDITWSHPWCISWCKKRQKRPQNEFTRGGTLSGRRARGAAMARDWCLQRAGVNL